MPARRRAAAEQQELPISKQEARALVDHIVDEILVRDFD
jgi:hypothetical protein